MTSASYPNSKNWQVEAVDSGSTLLAFIQHRMEERWSAKAIKRHIEAKGCLINGKLERFANRRLFTGDKISWRPIAEAPLQIKILYEDADLIAIDKPSGLLSSLEAITPLCPQAHSLVHRLDRETSGLLLLAKHQKAEELLTLQFQRREIAKTYLAITAGIPPKTHGIITNYLVRSTLPSHWRVSSIEGQGLYAETEWHRLSSSKKASLIECHPKTGRTHQLRVHLSHMGYPIAGDSQYGENSLGFQRTLLHAYRIELQQPMTRQQLQLLAPLPAAFIDACHSLQLECPKR